MKIKLSQLRQIIREEVRMNKLKEFSITVPHEEKKKDEKDDEKEKAEFDPFGLKSKMPTGK